MKIFLAGNWVDKPKKLEVTNPFDNSVIDTVPKADAADLEKALVFAERGAKVMAKLSSYERWKILRKAADLMPRAIKSWARPFQKRKEKSLPKGAVKPAGRLRPSWDRPRKPSGFTARPFLWTRIPQEVKNLDSRCECLAGSWRPSRRLIFRSIWFATKSDRHWLRVTR